jgi:hypothetical protein
MTASAATTWFPSLHEKVRPSDIAGGRKPRSCLFVNRPIQITEVGGEQRMKEAGYVVLTQIEPESLHGYQRRYVFPCRADVIRKKRLKRIECLPEALRLRLRVPTLPGRTCPTKGRCLWRGLAEVSVSQSCRRRPTMSRCFRSQRPETGRDRVGVLDLIACYH